MEKIKQKTETLIEALPYIQKYHDKIVVIKYGGNAMADSDIKKAVAEDIVLLKHVGINPVVVHGGGPDIDKEMVKARIKPKFVNGLRVTDRKTLSIVERVFEKINEELVSLIKKLGVEAITISGKDNKLIEVTQKDPRLGYVGRIKKINPHIIKSLIKEDYIPVISTIGIGKHNQSYNINADSAATAIAIALKAEKLTILTNVEGVFVKNRKISHLPIKEAKKLIRKGIINKGMIPKVEACMNAVQKGCPKAHLIDGTTKHALLLEIFTDRGIGTEIVK